MKRKKLYRSHSTLLTVLGHADEAAYHTHANLLYSLVKLSRETDHCIIIIRLVRLVEKHKIAKMLKGMCDLQAPTVGEIQKSVAKGKNPVKCRWFDTVSVRGWW